MLGGEEVELARRRAVDVGRRRPVLVLLQQSGVAVRGLAERGPRGLLALGVLDEGLEGVVEVLAVALGAAQSLDLAQQVAAVDRRERLAALREGRREVRVFPAVQRRAPLLAGGGRPLLRAFEGLALLVELRRLQRRRGVVERALRLGRAGRRRRRDGDERRRAVALEAVLQQHRELGPAVGHVLRLAARRPQQARAQALREARQGRVDVPRLAQARVVRARGAGPQPLAPGEVDDAEAAAVRADQVADRVGPRALRVALRRRRRAERVRLGQGGVEGVAVGALGDLQTRGLDVAGLVRAQGDRGAVPQQVAAALAAGLQEGHAHGAAGLGEELPRGARLRGPRAVRLPGARGPVEDQRPPAARGRDGGDAAADAVVEVVGRRGVDGRVQPEAAAGPAAAGEDAHARGAHDPAAAVAAVGPVDRLDPGPHVGGDGHGGRRAGRRRRRRFRRLGRRRRQVRAWCWCGRLRRRIALLQPRLQALERAHWLWLRSFKRS